MSGLWCEHFQEYGADIEMLDGVFAELSGWTIDSATPPRPGAKYVRLVGGFSGEMRRVFGAPKEGAGFGMRFLLPALPSLDASVHGGGGPCWAFLGASGVAQMIAFCGSDGGLVIARGPWDGAGAGGFTVIDRTDPCITARTFQTIELKCLPDVATGTFEIRVNGETVYNFTGNTDPLTTGEVSQAKVIGERDMLIADLHAWDTNAGNGPSDFVGNVAVFRRVLVGDETQADWTKSAGTVGFSLLKDKSDATGIVADTSGLKSAFQADTLPAGVTAIVYQQVKFRGQKTDAADCDVAPSMISTAGDETSVTGQHMTTLETWRWGIFGNDPHTAAPWTLTNANASQPAVTRTL